MARNTVERSRGKPEAFEPVPPFGSERANALDHLRGQRQFDMRSCSRDPSGDEMRVVCDRELGVAVEHALQQRRSGARTTDDEHTGIRWAHSLAKASEASTVGTDAGEADAESGRGKSRDARRRLGTCPEEGLAGAGGAR